MLRVKSLATQKTLDDFDFGYALAVHKAQGSQRDNVVFLMRANSLGKWLYKRLQKPANT